MLEFWNTSYATHIVELTLVAGRSFEVLLVKKKTAVTQVFSYLEDESLNYYVVLVLT